MLNGAQRRGVRGSSPGRQKLALLRREAGSEAPQTKFAAVVVEAMCERAQVWAPPSFNVASLRTAWTKSQGPDLNKELDFHAFDSFLQEALAPLYAKGKSCSADVAYHQMKEHFTNAEPKGADDKVLKK